MTRLYTILLFGMLLSACNQKQALDKVNAVYYWRTDLKLNAAERSFLHTHHINKVYCRYFDVVMRDDEPMPNATLTFSDTLPAGTEFVPTVYLTEDCMHQPHEGLADKLVRRINQINQTNDIKGVRELQIDCDYTARSRRVYYNFLNEVKARWTATHGQPSTLSTTIRLHQLQMEPPPADYGVLMLYNTGDPQHFEQRNPILDSRDVAPYLHHLSSYSLPLAAAYPVYRWVRHVAGTQLEHVVAADEILRVKRAAERNRPELSRTILTFHLDQENIDRYTPDEYEAIYHH